MLRVSVIIPTYNRWPTLRQTLTALQSQTLPPYEIIVVDDGSRDETPEALAREFPQVRYVRQQNAGPATARNKGIEIATGEVIAFTDDDCLPSPDWLEKFADGLTRHPEVVGVGGELIAPPAVLATNLFAQYENYLSRQVYQAGNTEIVAGFECPAGGTATMAYYKRILQEVNGFDATFPVAAGEDADLKLRICQKGYRLLYVPNQMLHLQEYNWRRFQRQCFVRGVGRNHFEKSHGAGDPSRLKVFLRAIRRVLSFPGDLFKMPLPIALIKLGDGLITCYGQWAGK